MLYRHLNMLVNKCLYLFPERTQLLEHYAFIGHLQHVSAVLAIVRCIHNIHEKVCIVL